VGFLKSLLGGGASTARREDDQVWMSAGARAAGLRKAVERAVAQRHGVVVVFASFAQANAVASDLEPFRSAGVVVATSTALPADVQPADAPVDVIVMSRSRTRAADDAIVAFADRLGPRASIGFWLSLDDALLAEHADRLGPILKALRVDEGEAITSSMVSRAIENAQKKNA
jgi:hypothetical protein